MNFSNIETFLCVARLGSITAAASALFISQPAVSARLQQLEAELGVTLIVRKKGAKKVTLTSHGTAFLPLAKQWMKLHKETSRFAQQHVPATLTLVGWGALESYLTQDLFRQYALLENRSPLRILLHSDARKILSMTENRQADIGLTFKPLPSNSIICQPLFSEKLVLVCSEEGNWPEGDIRLEDLDFSQELFLSWSAVFRMWHSTLWPSSESFYIRLHKVENLITFFESGQYWSFCPVSVVAWIQSQGVRIQVRAMTEQPPDRECYLLTPKEQAPSTAAAVTQFIETLLAHLHAVEKAVDGFHVVFSPQ